MGVLHITESEEQHAGQDNQKQLAFSGRDEEQYRQADGHTNQGPDYP